MPRLSLRVLFVVPLALCAIGCGGNDGVQSYTAPKSPAGDKPPAAEPATGEYRILGGMFPAGDPEWFFKLPGPADQLTKYEADFDKLLASVSLPANGPPKFDAPEGWKVGPGRGDFVTATVKTPDGKFEVTVTSSRGGVESNLRRWAVQQLGAKSFGPEDVAKVTTPVEAKGVKGLKADVRGPNNPSGGGGPFMGKK